jgi:hypothetical protein
MEPKINFLFNHAANKEKQRKQKELVADEDSLNLIKNKNLTKNASTSQDFSRSSISFNEESLINNMTVNKKDDKKKSDSQSR